ncbi:MAG: sulfatase [Bacteroidota bacterium]
MRLACWITALLFVGCQSAQKTTDEPRPNIILIYMDDLGWKDVGYAGSTFYETPNIDKLAASGMYFTQAYSAAPLCAPSRGAVVTGRSPARNKYTNVLYYDNHGPVGDALHDQSKEFGIGNQNLEAPHRHALSRENVLFAERLAEAGYETAYLGKWHNGWFDGFKPEDRGYQYVAGTAYEAFYDHVITPESVEKVYNLPEAKPGDYLADLLTDRAVEFMDQHQNNPFLIHLAHYLVHGPVTPKTEFLPHYTNKAETDQSNVEYATMVEAMDESVGRIMDKLSALNLLDNTLILFTSDNGGLTLDGITSNYPLRGGKSFAYEGGPRVPFIASWQGKIEPAQSSATRIIGTDIYPTILAAAGLPLDNQQHMDGKNLLPLLLNESPLEKRPLYFHFPHYTHATSPFSSIIADDHKLIRYYNDATGRYALYNLKEDIAEEHDLSAEQPELVQQLDAQLTQLLEAAEAEYPIPADSELGRAKTAQFYEGKVLGFSTKNIDSWRVRNKQSERMLANMERTCFEQKLQGDSCQFTDYLLMFEQSEVDLEKLKPFM